MSLFFLPNTFYAILVLALNIASVCFLVLSCFWNVSCFSRTLSITACVLKSMPANRFASLVPSEDWDADAFLSALVTHLLSYSWNELANLLSGSLLGVILVDGKFAFD